MNKVKEIPWTQIFLGTVFLYVGIHYFFSIGVKNLAGAIMVLPVAVAFFMRKDQAPIFLLCYTAMLFSVADRTIYVGPFYRIYPQELLFLSLSIYLLVTRKPLPGKSLIPVMGFVFFLLSVIAAFTGYFENRRIDIVLFYAKGLVMFLPIFFCVRRVVTDETRLRNVVACLLVAAAVGSAMNLADHFGLPIAKGIFGQTEKEVYSTARAVEQIVTDNPFQRTMGLHTFGGFIAAAVSLIFVVGTYLYHNAGSKVIKFSLLLAQGICLLYIFYAGYRGIWISVACSLILYAIHRGAKSLVMLVLLGCLVLAVIPQAAVERFSGLKKGEEDASLKRRMGMKDYAISVIVEKPILGGGWGAAGLAHSDILQLASDAGIVTSVSFVIFYFTVLGRLYRRFWQAKQRGHPRESQCLLVFFSALAAYFLIWMTETHLNMQETLFAFWLILALGAQAVRIPLGESRAFAEQK